MLWVNPPLGVPASFVNTGFSLGCSNFLTLIMCLRRQQKMAQILGSQPSTSQVEFQTPSLALAARRIEGLCLSLQPLPSSLTFLFLKNKKIDVLKIYDLMIFKEIEQLEEKQELVQFKSPQEGCEPIWFSTYSIRSHTLCCECGSATKMLSQGMWLGCRSFLLGQCPVLIQLTVASESRVTGWPGPKDAGRIYLKIIDCSGND